MRHLRLIVVLSAVSFATLSLAGGTVELQDIEPLLRQSGSVRDFLTSSLDLDHTVMAAVRLSSDFDHLGGARMGPYFIHARPKGAHDGRDVEIVLCTDTRFLDASGKPAATEFAAFRVEETLTAVMLREAGTSPAMPRCP